MILPASLEANRLTTCRQVGHGGGEPDLIVGPSLWPGLLAQILPQCRFGICPQTVGQLLRQRRSGRPRGERQEQQGKETCSLPYGKQCFPFCHSCQPGVMA